MDKLSDPVHQVLDEYRAAVLAKDVDRFIALYDTNVLVFDMWGVWTYDGIAPWRDMAAGWFGSLGTDRVIVDFADTQAHVTHDLAVVHAFVKYKAIDTDGIELRAMDNRMTATLRQQGDAWKIFHQHTSAPIAFDTTKALFQRS
ncbi:MAG TPA: nuclear transport factor 2 family protein [Pararobbsia sp.]|nr:nuclear transport factor 2 family protein [Pararobbsia sp.]